MNPNNIQKLTKALMLVSMSLIVLLSLLMVLNWAQVKTLAPMQNSNIDQLIQKLNENPNNEALRAQIRTVDLLSRKAYFSSVWQLELGGYLLLFNIILFIAAMYIYKSYKPIDYKLGQTVAAQFWFQQFLARKWLVLSVASLAVAALLISFSTGDYYTNFSANQYAQLKPETINVKETKKEEVSHFNNFTEEATTEVEENTESEALKDTAQTTVYEAVIVTEENNTNTGDLATSNETVKTEKLVKEPVVDVNDFPSLASVKKNHASFRGVLGQGFSQAKNTPTDWDAATGKNIKWKQPIELPGLNSPVIWGDLLFMAGSDGKTQKVYCYHRLSGKLLWAKAADNIEGSPAVAPKVTSDTGHSASSVTTDGKRVFAIFSTGDIICFNNQGERLWDKNLGVPDNHYGHSSSLLFYENKLLVQYDHNKSQSIMALSVHTGDVIWNTKREGSISWSSPIVVVKGGKAQVIVNNEPWVAAYDMATGSEIWKIDCLMGEIGPSPAYGNGTVFVANEYAVMVAIKDGKKLWEGYDFLPDASSPVAYGDYIFATTSYGEMACLNQSDGSEVWVHEFDNGFYGSPVIADGKLYIIDRTGITRIVEASGEFKIIGEPSIGEKSDCTPTFADGMIYVKGEKNLYCISN